VIAYFDLPSGLSGDMFLACLISSGWPEERLRAAVGGLSIPADEWSVEVQTVTRRGIAATPVHVKANSRHDHRHLSRIRNLIQSAPLADPVKARATAVFTRLAAAEAKVHGSDLEGVHFHEIGALDAIIDVVGCVAGLHELGVSDLYCSPLPLGDGWTDSDHGRLPLPAPATLELIAAVRAPTRPAPGPGEWLTPTAAALVAELASFQQPQMRIRHIGVGAGQRDPLWPNIARLWLGDMVAADGAIVQLDTNIDNMNPELLPPVFDALSAAGALDVWLTPVHMKKGRPGVILSALAPADREAQLAGIILNQTTTLGLRVHPVRRHETAREIVQVPTPFGPVDVKLKRLDGCIAAAMPEYEACRKLAATAHIPVAQVYDAARAAAQALLAPHHLQPYR